MTQNVTDRRDWVTWLGLGVVGVAAAVMSFTALSELARLCGITAMIPLGRGSTLTSGPVEVPVAWLLPLTVDVLAGIATRVWLQRRVNAEALAYARRAAWSAIVATVVGNAAHGALAQSDTPAPWWAVVVVSAVPAVALGAMVHLAVLVGRGPDEPGADRTRNPPRQHRLRSLVVSVWARLEQAGREQADPVETVDEPVPTSGDADDVLVADLRRLNLARQSKNPPMPPLVRDAVARRYGIGSPRATRIKESAEQPTGPTVTLVKEIA